MFKKVFLTILCLCWALCFEELGFGQTTYNDTDTIRHYILLLDASGSFRKTTGSKRYFSFVKDILEMETHEVHDDYLPYRPGSDIVSIVFFHFPVKRSLKIQGIGFYTSEKLVLMQGTIDKMQTIIENFVEERMDDFRELAVSPIGLSEVTVFPYVNEYLRDKHLTISNRVDKIYLISLSDEQYIYEEAGIKSALESFAFENHKRYYNTLRRYMKTHFKDLVKLEYISNPVDSPGTNTIHFHFYEIKPKIENIALRWTNKVALDRIAQKLDKNSEPEMYWKGFNDICLDNPTGYKAWVEWALPSLTDDNAPWIWYRCDSGTENQNQGLKVLSAGCRSTCGDDPKDATPPVLIKKRKTMWTTVEEVKRFKEEIWYRGVVDIDREKDRLSYPFNARYYMTPQKVEYVSGEVTVKGESNVPYYYEYNVSWYNPINLLGIFVSWTDKTEITDEILKEKLKDKEFCLMVKKYINKEKLSKRFKEYYDAFAGNNFSELPAEILSETSKIRAMADENWGTLRAWIFYLLVIGLTFFLHRFYVRPVDILFNIDTVSHTNNTIELDFSKHKRAKVVLAIFQLENMIYTLHPLKKNPNIEFIFDIEFKFSSPNESFDIICEHESLLSIVKQSFGKEHMLNPYGNSFYSKLRNVRFKQNYELLLNLSAIKDIKTDIIQDKITSFYLSISAPQARNSRGKKLNISSIKTGTRENFENQWNYSVNLYFQPERSKKEILIKPVENEITENPEYYVLDYTSKRSWVKLFDIQVKNVNTHLFSYPVPGKFSFKVNDSSNNPIFNVFYIPEIEIDSTVDGVSINEIPVYLKKSEEKRLNLYIKFEDFPNPVDHCDYTIISYFDDKIVDVLNIRINRSKEKTEALITLLDDDEAVPIYGVGQVDVTRDNSLLVHKNSKDHIPIHVEIPENGRKGIKEYGDADLFTLRLKNNCNTGTGFYNWRIDKITAESDAKIEFQKKTNAIELIPDQYQGKIQDNRDQEEEIEFFLDHKNVKAFHSYHFSFELKFALIFELFPKGEIEDSSAPAEKLKEKQLDFSIHFLCYHDVKDNYLIINFGISTICAYYYTQYPDVPEYNLYRVPLQSPMGQLPSENDLLPTIINLKNTIKGKEEIMAGDIDVLGNIAAAGSEHFVDLPAKNDIFYFCPSLVLYSIELLVIQGIKIVPIPEQVDYGLVKRDFVYLDEKGALRKGNPSLSSVLKSCYENLLKNYIEVSGRRYRKVLIINPNVYLQSHFSFLKNEVLKDVFAEKGRVYFENIILENESNCLLYYYLSNRSGDDLPDRENVLIIDIGASTLDLSYTRVTWEEEMGVITPSRIEVIKRDGIAVGGDTLDKAIALQVHDILKKFTGVKDFNYANKIASNEDFKLDTDIKMRIKKIMFDFKIKHILEFKKKINSSSGDDIVGICLGENSMVNGLCELCGESLDTPIEEGKSIKAKLINRFGKIFLEMKKQDWLLLPYLKCFQELLIGKLQAFAKELSIPQDISIILSGMTSLWPAIPQAFSSAFEGSNIKIADIWSQDIEKRKIEQKQAVILGAIQKVIKWNNIAFQDTEISGTLAIRYQKGVDPCNPKAREITTFKENEQVLVNLANSSYFELGIKTSMDFVPLIGAVGYKRDDYCDRDKRVEITLEKMTDGKGYNFYIKSDKYPKGKEARLIQVLSHETAFFRTRPTHWPVREVQLRDIPPEQFNENV